MDYCAAFNSSTGFEDIEYFRKETQIAATAIIATTVVVSQIWLLLLFLPLPQLPKCMRKLDLELNFEEIFTKKKKSSEDKTSETDELLSDKKEQTKRRKRAAGGVATLTITVILIIVSTTSFVVTSESPGSVSYQSNLLSSTFDLIDRSKTALGLIFDFERAVGRVQNTYLVYIDPLQSDFGISKQSSCQLTPKTPSPNGVLFSLDVGKFKVNPNQFRGIQTYATVCRSVAPFTSRAFSISAHAPVTPSLSTYPPPGTFTDTPVVVNSREVTTKTTVPVVSLTWTWTEMVSTSVLDLLAPLTTSRRLQAKVAYDLSTRGINGSFTFLDARGGSVQYPWPTCDSFAGYEPALSFIMYYQPSSPNNQSYIVSETSFLSWAFATLITLGSVIALKPTITNYLDKLSNYWRMKLWARWVLFSLYTLLMPLPMLFVLFRFITNERLEVRGANFSYSMYMNTLLIIMSALLMATWVGVLVRTVYTNRMECIRRKKDNNAEVNLSIENGNAEYDAL
jgi:hypothetical protein